MSADGKTARWKKQDYLTVNGKTVVYTRDPKDGDFVAVFPGGKRYKLSDLLASGASVIMPERLRSAVGN